VGDEVADLHPPVSIFATGWQTALARPPRIKLDSLSWKTAAPAVVSIPVHKPRLKTVSLAFSPADPPAFLQPDRDASQRAGRPKAASEPRPKPAARRTRVAPPGDIVKLEDRLFYLLQPPLESLLHADALDLPFEPFPYQYDGIAFLYPRYAAILADEMGLGKTMQAITTIRLLLCSGELRNVLLICPKPLVTNWQREFALWAPEVAVGVIQGDKARRDFQWQQPRTPVKIANYELLMRDRAVFENERQHFDLVVLDEAQRIKNRSSTTSQVVRSISRSRSWALTGTPVENSAEDLVGIFEFLSPGYLQSGMPAQQMGRAIGDYVMRRTKDMVLTDLPPKMYRDAELDLTPDQWSSYKTAEDEGVVQLAEMGQEVTIQHVFELVLRLKQICNFDPSSGSSSKLERLEADLEEVAASGQKAIVFSQWVNTLDQIRSQLTRFHPLEYHGGIPSRRRDEIIRNFREDPKRHVLLMSYGAGAVGLNLQFCGYVFLFDRWWNPAVEDQAINRAHRIGAAGPVTVTRMITLETIEERINQVLEEKRQLFQNMFLHAGKPQSTGLTQEEVFGLFNLSTPRRSHAA
jgi:SNF2 family DNA or RNA helicase